MSNLIGPSIGADMDAYERFMGAEEVMPNCHYTDRGHDFSEGGQCECGRFACNEQGCDEPDDKECEGFCKLHYHQHDEVAS